jgi:uncharacterized OB-fold protein
MAKPSSSIYPRDEFWQALERGSFELPRCAMCGALNPPSASQCIECGSTLLNWRPEQGSGHVYSLMERHSGPGQTGQATVIVVIQLDAGPRMMGVMVAKQGAVGVGIRVKPVLEPASGPDGLPQFSESAK